MINKSGAWHNPNHAEQGFDIVFTSEDVGGLIWFNHSGGERIHLNGDFELGKWSKLYQTSGGTLFDDTGTVLKEVGFFKLEETINGLLFTFDIDPTILPEYGYDGIDLVPLFLGRVSLWARPMNDQQGIFMIEKDGVTAGHYYGNPSGAQEWMVFSSAETDDTDFDAYIAYGGRPFKYESTEPEHVADLAIRIDEQDDFRAEMIWSWTGPEIVERYVIERFYQSP